MGERQGKKLESYNTNGGLLFRKWNWSVHEKRPHLVGAAFGETGDGLWDSNRHLGAMDGRTRDSGNSEGISASRGVRGR